MINFVSMKTVISFIIIALVLFSAACKPSSNNSVTGGGLGGNATLNISPEHSNSFVDSCWVYIKYGTLDAPANGVYDDSQYVHMADTTPTVTFSGLKNGIYYIFANGYHAVYQVKVKGGLSWTITKQDVETVYVPTYPFN